MVDGVQVLLLLSQCLMMLPSTDERCVSVYGATGVTDGAAAAAAAVGVVKY